MVLFLTPTCMVGVRCFVADISAEKLASILECVKLLISGNPHTYGTHEYKERLNGITTNENPINFEALLVT